jgi:hypothetical protein
MSEHDMNRLISTLQRALGSSWREVSDYLRTANTVDAIAGRIENGDLANVVEDVRAAAAKWSAENHDAYERAGRTAARQLDSKVSDALVRFDVTNDRAVRRAKVNEYELIQGFTAEQRAITRRVISEGMTMGVNPREMARELRDSIGLTDHQSQIVANYRRQLEQGQYAEASSRRLVNGRDTRSLVTAAERGKALSPARIDTLVENYRQGWINHRAETIARTEGLRAAHEGSEDLYEQAISRGDVDADELVKEWHSGPATEDHRPDHRAMNGKTVPIGEEFVLPDGTRMKHPGDPRGGAKHVANCRCTFSVTYKAPAGSKPSSPKPAANAVTPSTKPKAPEPPPPTPQPTEPPDGFNSDGLKVRAGLPSRSKIRQDTGYVVDPAAIKDQLIALPNAGSDPVRLQNIRNAWAEGKELPPIRLGMLPDGRLFVDDGRHRLLVAMEQGRPVLVRLDRSVQEVETNAVPLLR